MYGFSQSDEDGITLEILKRINLEKGVFTEFGVGDGLENNSIILLMQGWKGAWFGGENIVLDTSKSLKLKFQKVWITRNNIFELYSSNFAESDVVSLDLDGNDYYLIEELLKKGAKPKLFIVEYNAKFPPHIFFKIKYRENHKFADNDYYGASLRAFNELFESFGYRLVCCNSVGVNAFFVLKEYSKYFNDIPTDLNDLYCEPFMFVRSNKQHPTAKDTIQSFL